MVKGLGCVFLLALALRAWLLLAIGPKSEYAFFSDSYTYAKPAHVLRHQGAYAVYHDGRLIPEVYRTPGYPLFLVPFLNQDGSLRLRCIQWVQALLNSISAALVFWAAFYFWKDIRAACLAGIGFAVDFVGVVHCAFVLTDTLFVFFICLSLYGLVRQRLVMTAASAAASAFVRPVGLYYGALLAVLYLLMGRGLKPPVSKARLLALLMTLLLPIAGWFARNHHVSGRWTFSTLQDDNLFLVRVALVEVERRQIPYAQAVDDIRKAHRQAPGAPSQSLWASRYLMKHWTVYTKLMARDLLKLLTGNSMKVAAWMFLHDTRYEPLAQPVYATETPIQQARHLIQRHPWFSILLVLYLCFLFSIYGLALWGLRRCWHEAGWQTTLLLSLPLCYFLLVTLGADAHARYRLPLMPALFLLAGGGFQAFAQRRRDKIHPR